MKAKYGSKRKLSFRYLCWLCGLLILFIAFFLVLVFSCDIFEDIETAEIIRINAANNDGLQEIIFLVDGEEFAAYYQMPTKSALKVYLEVGDKIQYLVEDPSVIYLKRPLQIGLLSGAEAVLIALLIGTTIYEIKKGM